MSKPLFRRVVVAPDKFKGSASAHEVTSAIARGIRSILPQCEIVELPMADGGDGTVALFVESGAAEARKARVHDPLGREIDATYALFEGTRAIVELASASGLVLLEPDERDPWHADTRGTGELIRAALDAGAREVIVGLGGSATNDAGIGLLRALGVRTTPPSSVHEIEAVDFSQLDSRLAQTALVVASDVDNPLCGPNGATAVFGPQKGVKPEDVERLDSALARTADAMARALGRDLRDVPGAGAAGGAGFALLALGAKLRPGVEIVAELRGLDRALEGATLCVTGEGAIDAQTLRGKTVAGVGRHAQRCGVPVIAIGGSIERSVEPDLWQEGIAVVPIAMGPAERETLMKDAPALIEAAAARLARSLTLRT
ncbi:MAG: glycerate kinase [Candidatus Eremiobacteraeota bacterium]|nr:glycerate kinase [Candidatus Eremiobacteraeota bacterium]